MSFRSDNDDQRTELTRVHHAELLGRLAGGMAHELNNCLATIRIYGDLAVANLGHRAAVREAIEEIDRTAEHAGAMVRRLLSFGREPQDRRGIVDPAHALRRVATLIEHAFPKHIEVEVDLRAEQTSVLVDLAELDQVILNLAFNASDAMPDGGTLVLSARSVDLKPDEAKRLGVQPGPHAVLGVADSGSGMGPETLEHIFEPSFTTKEDPPRMGLGLARVAEVVHGSGGGISVDSEPGVGTSFEIFFPLASDPAGDSPPARSGPEQSGTETILIVETDDALRAVAGRLLEKQGYRVIRARNLPEARERARAHDGVIDLLLTDAEVPNETARDLDALRAPGARPLRYLSIGGHADGRRTVTKPFGGEDLLEAIRHELSG